jgi:hypothetical protein
MSDIRAPGEYVQLMGVGCRYKKRLTAVLAALVVCELPIFIAPAYVFYYLITYDGVMIKISNRSQKLFYFREITK